MSSTSQAFGFPVEREEALPPHGVSRFPHLAARGGGIRNSQVQTRVASERRLARIYYPNIGIGSWELT